MNEQEYKNAVQLLLSQEGNNYLIGLYILLEYKTLEHICDLVLSNYIAKGGIYHFGDYFIIAMFSGEITTYKKIESKYLNELSGKAVYFSKLNSNKPKYRYALLRKELQKHLIRIFDSLV